jgi:hypothetical protein
MDKLNVNCYPIPKYCIFKEYVSLTTGSDPLGHNYNVIRVPKDLLLEIAASIKNRNKPYGLEEGE